MLNVYTDVFFDIKVVFFYKLPYILFSCFGPYRAQNDIPCMPGIDGMSTLRPDCLCFRFIGVGAGMADNLR